uniref:NAC domain-containing protein n=1 Tax=Vitis vinifera TaxID=29760 RepID=F6I2Z9_VITVI
MKDFDLHAVFISYMESEKIQTYGPEWFFFSPLYKKYRKRNQLQRTTNVGYWKPTGPARDIKRGVTEEVIGTKKTLVFHMGGGHGHADVTTGWVIHE